MNHSGRDEDYLKTLSILYVEDDEVTREMLALFLERNCARLILAANGLEGLSACDAHSPDIVITDIQMPKMNGLDMARRIRASNATIPLIITTAFDDVDFLKQALDIGLDKYVSKPIIRERLLTVLLDCARRLRLENEQKNELQASKALMRFVCDSTLEAIYGIDLHGCCTFCNQICLDMLGYESSEELLDRNMHNLIHHTLSDGRHAALQECRICNAFKSGRGTHVDNEILWRKDGSSFPVEYWAYPQWKDGEIMGAVVTFMDISDRIKNDLLLKQVQRQVVHQEKLASIGQLAAGVAHEINNPMGFITSNLTSLGKYADRLDEYIAALQQSLFSCPSHPDTSEIDLLRQKLKVDYIISDVRELVNESLDGANRVRRIVQDLKSFSRVDSAECCSTNLNDALETTINIAWNELKYLATLERNFGEIPDILCNPQQLNQVFLNLLINAAHALDNNQGTITVTTWSEQDSVFISVRDTGKGMDEETRKKIFEPFFTTKPAGKGTGLGLSISSDIVCKHGGEILVKSKPGQGSTFTVRLPIRV